ncbi:hypothetical protein MSG28_015553, partial [Choristoneura fumiferana]
MENEVKTVIRVGSRKSELALIQTNFVIDSLKKANPEKEFTIVTMTTLGDRILDVSLPKIGEKSLFTKDLEDALRNNTVDFVVHSLKDLPTSLPDGLAIGALHMRHPRLCVQDVRGNLNTRLRKLDSGGYAALLLAAAGLQRMGWGDRVSKCRADDHSVLALLAPFNHAGTYCRVLAERSFLKTLVWSMDGTTTIDHSLEQTFAQIKKTTKHKLSATEDCDSKKIKTGHANAPNPIEELNKRISEKAGNLNCEDTRSIEEIQALKKAPKIFCGLTENLNMPVDVIQKCDDLGRDLAESLIAKGALEVMK